MAIAIRSAPGRLGRPTDRELAPYVAGAVGADNLRPRGLAHVLLLTIVIFFAVFLAWADWAMLDEVTRGEGRVIPSRQIQVVQNLEGGIVAALLVREGEVVDKDQVLTRIDNIRAESDYKEKRSRYLVLLASIARLQAEIDEKPVAFPAEVTREARDIAEGEMRLFNSRQETLQGQLEVLRRQAEQRQQELKELKSKLEHYERSFKIASEELKIAEQAASQRIVARADLLRQQRDLNELSAALEQARLSIPRAEAAVREASQRIAGTFSNFRSDALKELSDRNAELAGIREIVLAGADRVRRTEVRSPVRGTIKQIKINTIGGVVQPGQDLIEIVPLEDTLLVEAHVRPADIAFLRPGLPATVKITAYDFAIYGGLKGRVEDISADTIANEKGESFYRVRVRTDQNHIGTPEHPLEIIPGMTAQIDVLTGHKTVLTYLLKPILKARERALRER